MSKLNSWALRRAYAKGNRAKAVCSICGKDIYNRMMTRPDPVRCIYAHTSNKRR